MHFLFKQLAPYGAQPLIIQAHIIFSDQAGRSVWDDPKDFLGPEKYIESGHPRVRRLAETLQAMDKTRTAERIYRWVADHVQYAGYFPHNRGALYALTHRKGDCSEYMFLFAALCRAAGIPARCIAGYPLPSSGILKPADYHHWSEFFCEGRWHIVDPQYRKFKPDSADYIAMKMVRPSLEGSVPQFDRFRFAGKGLKVKMNS